MKTTPLDALHRLAATDVAKPSANGAAADVTGNPRVLRSSDQARARAWALAALRGEAAKVASVQDGHKHDRLLKSARTLGGYIPYISESEIEDALYNAVADRAEDKRAARDTIRDGIRHGSAEPLDIPEPLPRNGWHEDHTAPTEQAGPSAPDSTVKDKTPNKGSTFNNAIGPIYFTGKAAPPPQEWLVQDVLPATYPGMIHGEGGASKSFFGLAGGLCMASGTPFLEKTVVQRPVGFIDFELGEEEQQRRALAVAKGLGLPDIPHDFAYFGCAGYDLATVKSYLTAWLADNPGGVFILDSFGAASTGNIKAEDVVIQAMRDLRALGAGGLFVLDHQAKLQSGEDYANKSAYGSVYKFNLCRVVWQLELVDSVTGQATVLLRNKKNNFGPKLPDMGVDIVFDSVNGTVTFNKADITTGALSTRTHLDTRIKLAIQDAPNARATSKAIAEALDANLGSVKARISVLKGRHEVIEAGKINHEVEWGLTSRRSES